MELFVDDIYNADGTLKVQGKTFNAPKSMNQALGLTTWNFSLVNWYPDLTETYLNAEPFIRALGKGDDLDGIITIDITFIQKLLNKWGGICLLYTSDAADDLLCVDLGGRRIIKKKKYKNKMVSIHLQSLKIYHTL